MGRRLEFAVGVLNGTVGDYLARTGNGLATPMTLAHAGQPLDVTREALRRAYPHATPRVSLLIHGIMCTEDIFRFPDGSDYGTKLKDDVGLTPLYLRYNSGLAIPDNGAHLATLLGALVEAWPVPLTEIVPIGYSMGGLVFRSACHVASENAQPWLSLVKRAVYVGTPHRGATTERAGRILARVLGSVPDPVTQLIGDIANLRSDGVKDLGDADLRHEDRARRDWTALKDRHHPVPLLPGIRHHLLAGSVAMDTALSALFGDSVVPLGSATNGAMRAVEKQALAPEHVKILAGINHMGLAHHPHVYAQLRAWLTEEKT